MQEEKTLRLNFSFFALSFTPFDVLIRVVELNPSWDKLVPGNLVSQLLASGDAQTILEAAQIFRNVTAYIYMIKIKYFKSQ